MGRRRAPVLLFLALAAALTGGCSDGSRPDGSGPSSPAARRVADLDALAEALSRHPSPPDLSSSAEAVRRRAGSLTDAQWLVELMRLTAGRDRDGHTGIFPLAQPGLELWPLQLYAFSDGWRVAAALPPYADLVGGTVTAVGGLPVEQAVERVTPLVPHDNPSTVLARAPQWLVTPQVLEGLGLPQSLEVDGKVITPEPVPTAEFAAWSSSFYPLVVPRLPPVPEQDLQVSRRGRAAVMGFHRVIGSSGDTTVDVLAAELERLARTRQVDRVVVDLRRNSGGENGSYPPLLRALQAVDEARPGSIRLLLSRTTFSAATNFVAEVLSTTSAVTVGEPMGGAPNMWGDARETTLPESGLVVHVATRLWELGGRDLRATIPVDHQVPVEWSDVESGRDRVLDVALAV